LPHGEPGYPTTGICNSAIADMRRYLLQRAGLTMYQRQVRRFLPEMTVQVTLEQRAATPHTTKGMHRTASTGVESGGQENETDTVGCPRDALQPIQSQEPRRVLVNRFERGEGSSTDAQAFICLENPNPAVAVDDESLLKSRPDATEFNGFF
jgi:hypothetical protein